jgi:predicted glycosyltransferase
MIQTALKVLFDSIDEDDKEIFLEAMHALLDPVAKEIINKTSIKPRAIDEFGYYETTIVRYADLLEHIGVLERVWDGTTNKLAITELGREISNVFKLDAKYPQQIE